MNNLTKVNRAVQPHRRAEPVRLTENRSYKRLQLSEQLSETQRMLRAFQSPGSLSNTDALYSNMTVSLIIGPIPNLFVCINH